MQIMLIGTATLPVLTLLCIQWSDYMGATAFALMLVGNLLNLSVMHANGGKMPVKELWSHAGPDYIQLDEKTRFPWLADIINLKIVQMSIGDIPLKVGLAIMLVWLWGIVHIWVPWVWRTVRVWA